MPVKLREIFILMLMSCVNCFGQKIYNFPPAIRKNHIDTLWEKPINDSYRWLEDLNSEETKNWLVEQEKFKDKCEGFAYYSLLKYLPLYSSQRLKKIYKYGKYFFTFKVDNFDLPVSIYYRTSEEDEPKFLFNPGYLDKSAIISIDACSMSDDNNTLAMMLSKNGGDWKTIRFLNMENKKLLDDTIDFVKYSPLYWFRNKVYYVRYNVKQTSESFSGLIKGRALFCHTIGTRQENDKLIFRTEDDENVFEFEITPEKKYLILHHQILHGNNKFKVVSLMTLSDSISNEFKDFIISKKDNEYFKVLGVVNGMLLVQSNFNAPQGSIYKFNPNAVNQAEVLIPQFEERLEYSKIIGHKILTVYDDKKKSFTIICDINGKPLSTFDFPEGYSFSDFSGSVNDSVAYFSFNAFFDPSTAYKINLNTFVKEPVSKTYVWYDNKDLTTEKIFYYSKDSTVVPMYLTHRKDIKLNGNNPVILYGYGGFGISTKPFYKPSNIIFLKSGGVLAVPCLRGGGDFPGWHEKGRRLNKQNTFDDFIYAAEYLISKKYTNPDKIAAMGSSNGGLLVAACMIQRPDLFRVVVAEAGVMDMLRYHLFNIGNYWKNEYGDVTDTFDFNNLLNYSPVQNVKPGIDYPATLLVASDNDDRVHPFHSFKFLARLQANRFSKNPYVLYYQQKGGHGGSDIYQEEIKKDAYVYSFIYEHLDIAHKIKYREN